MRFNQATTGRPARTVRGRIGAHGPAGGDLEGDAGGLAEVKGAEVIAAGDRRHPGAEADHALAPDALVPALARPGDMVDGPGRGDRADRAGILVDVASAAARALDPKAARPVGREVEAAGEQVGAGEAIAAASVDAVEAAQREPLRHLGRGAEERLVARGVDPHLVLEALGIGEAQGRERVPARRIEAHHDGAGGAKATLPEVEGVDAGDPPADAGDGAGAGTTGAPARQDEEGEDRPGAGEAGGAGAGG